MKSKKVRNLGTILVLVIIGICAICYCPHKVTYTNVVKEATCFELGQIDTICTRCDTVLEKNSLEKTAHIFGDYELIIKPTALGPGLEARVCDVCLKEEKREYYCPHNETNNKVIKEASCYEHGQIDTICELCEVVLENNILEKTAHTFGDYELIINPSASGPGLEVRVCDVCLKEEKREYYCPHNEKYNKVIKEATCYELGRIDTICELCETVLEKNSLEKSAHQYSKEGWTYVKYATPFEKGERYKDCSLCGERLSETYTIPELEDNSIYITGTDIKHGFTISSFTQNAVDTYEIVYTEQTDLGSNNPFVLGHNYGILGGLDQTKVGEHIYLYINGVIEIYEVIISEYGTQNSSGSDIIGQTTGTSIWHQYECKTLHMYTCYANSVDGRWIVLAKKIF